MATIEAYVRPKNLSTAVYTIDPAGGTGNPYTINLHPYELGTPVPQTNARINIVSRTASQATSITLTTSVGMIVNPYSFTPVASMDLLLQGQSIQLVYVTATSQWMFIQAPRYSLFESWQATPILDINGTTINWTYMPSALSATPFIFSHAAGVLTFTQPTNELVRTSLSVENTISMGGNNSTINWSYDPVFSGAGIDTLFRIVDAYSDPRLGDQLKSHQILGSTYYAPNDTIQFNGTAIGSNASVINLDAAIVTFAFDR